MVTTFVKINLGQRVLQILNLDLLILDLGHNGALAEPEVLLKVLLQLFH